MATNSTQAQRLGGNGWKAMNVVTDSLVRLATIRRLSERLDHANEHSNYRLVAALNAELRKEAITAAKTLSDAAMGKY